MALRIPRFDRSVPIVDKEGKPTLAFHQWWNSAAKAIEDSINGIQAALDAAAAAQASANTAQIAAEAAQTAVETLEDFVIETDERTRDVRQFWDN